MNLLGAKLYDPAGAVSKATSSLLAMTALDTTNLRLTVTVPAHGFVRVKMTCPLEGATTFSQILLGVLVGSTVTGRIAPQVALGGTAVATTRAVAVAEFTIPGLTPGSTVFDAAYGVEIAVASTNIKYGGPNNTTTDDAWGGFLFEIWDPQPLPTAANGAVNGLLTAPTTANVGTVDVLRWNGTAVSAPATAGIPDVNMKNIANSAVSSTSAQIGANVVQVNGQTATAAAGVTFPSSIASPTNITSGNISNVNGNVTGTVATLTTYTGNTPQTGDSFARLGVAGVGLTNLGDTRLANLDATVSSRGTYSGGNIAGNITGNLSGSVGSVTAGVTVSGTVTLAGTQTFNMTGNITGNLSGSVGSVVGLTASNLDTTISSRMATYTQPTGFLAATFPLTVASTTNITAGNISNVNGNVTGSVASLTSNADKTGYSLSGTQTFNLTGNITGNLSGSVGTVTSAVTVGNVTVGGYSTGEDPATLVLGAVAASWNTPGTIGADINSAASAGDPWTTSLPGSYTVGEAGYILGTNLDALVSSRGTYSGGDITGNITGNLIGNITGDLAGNITGNITGSIASVGNVTGDVGGNVTGSVQGDVSGNVTGSVSRVVNGPPRVAIPGNKS